MIAGGQWSGNAVFRTNIHEDNFRENKMNRLVYLMGAIAITGCALREPQAQPSARATAQVGIVNHTGNYIYSASVDGAGGGNMARWGAGVADICCASISNVWHPE